MIVKNEINQFIGILTGMAAIFDKLNLAQFDKSLSNPAKYQIKNKYNINFLLVIRKNKFLSRVFFLNLF